jgi:hypothetical protein
VSTLDRNELEAWILRAQISLLEGQPQVARIELEKALQVLHAVSDPLPPSSWAAYRIFLQRWMTK